MAEDLRRFLGGEPILARPVSFWERGIKWAKRRPALAALFVVSTAAVLTLAVESGSNVVDREALGMLADATNGQMLELDELPRIGELVKGEPMVITQPHESEVWDNWLMLVLLTVLYCIDLSIRWMTGMA